MKEKITWFLGIIVILFLLTTQVFASISQDLFKAIEKGNLEEVKSAIGKGANVNERDPLVGDTPLVRAIREGNLDIVKCLVEHGVRVNEFDAWNDTPLHKAVSHQHLNIVKFLVENGANINAKEKANGKTPLMEAVFWNNFDIVDYLVMRGADINERDNRGRTALDMAKQSGAQAIVNRLEGRPSEEKLIATNHLVKVVERGDLDGIKSSLNQGADINKKMFCGWSLFVYAANRKYDVYGKNIEIAKYLIEHGADVNLKDDDGVYPLIHMINWDYFDLVKILVEKGAKIEENVMDTALHLAAQNGNFDMFSYLVEKGGNVRKKGMHLFIAVATVLGFRQEVSPSRLKIIDYLIEKGVDINEKNDQGWTALSQTTAAAKCSCQLAKYLIARGAKVDERNNEGRTPLMMAVTAICFEMVECLVENGADVTAKDKQGKTVLDIAQESAKSAKERAKFGPAYKMKEDVAYKIENYLKRKISR